MAIRREDLYRIDFSDVDSGLTIEQTRPGMVLLHEFMQPAGISAYALAKVTGVPANRITAILHGKRTITADTALRLAKQFGTSAELWMNLQTAHDLAVARREMAKAG